MQFYDNGTLKGRLMKMFESFGYDMGSMTATGDFWALENMMWNMTGLTSTRR
ncbi:MAG: hypothetical protein IIT39_07350 [Clostridia bacterium]|jgi:hypothetical protein|nr:hypothetical protein [Clostridia bacterium]